MAWYRLRYKHRVFGWTTIQTLATSQLDAIASTIGGERAGDIASLTVTEECVAASVAERRVA